MGTHLAKITKRFSASPKQQQVTKKALHRHTDLFSSRKTAKQGHFKQNNYRVKAVHKRDAQQTHYHNTVVDLLVKTIVPPAFRHQLSQRAMDEICSEKICAEHLSAIRAGKGSSAAVKRTLRAGTAAPYPIHHSAQVTKRKHQSAVR
ncbi:hypothetical protein Tcan_16566 [Toxocara canis]|uniref:Uncharacterized protein n=1 Tax=Toxocara canis TaxID=6265 RepID=A0A0B2VCP5_TOXCA|nr:hypothetical protein Tcan_16566 [Toxocara canis]